MDNMNKQTDKVSDGFFITTGLSKRHAEKGKKYFYSIYNIFDKKVQENIDDYDSLGQILDQLHHYLARDEIKEHIDDILSYIETSEIPRVKVAYSKAKQKMLRYLRKGIESSEFNTVCVAETLIYLLDYNYSSKYNLINKDKKLDLEKIIHKGVGMRYKKIDNESEAIKMPFRPSDVGMRYKKIDNESEAIKMPFRPSDIDGLISNKVYSDVDSAYNYLTDNNYFTEEELSLVTSINGYNIDTLNDCIYARYGDRNLEQLRYGDDDDDEDEE